MFECEEGAFASACTVVEHDNSLFSDAQCEKLYDAGGDSRG